MAKSLPSSRIVPEHTRVNEASAILKRFYVMERELMRALAVWMIDTPPVELKFQLAEDMWQASRHADALRTRVLELRYPRRDVDKKYDPNVLALCVELSKASSYEEFIAGVYGVVIPALIADYDAYLARTDALDDAPTVYMLRQIVAEKRAQGGRMDALRIAAHSDTDAEWRDYLTRWILAIGGIDGEREALPQPSDHPCAGRAAHHIPATVQRDTRFRPALFHLPHENKYDTAGAAAWRRIEALDQRVAMQVWSAISHFNEIWAAEIPASVMWELPNEVWDFYLDLARWIYDETRHSHMGYRAMQGWGWDVPALCPYGNALYNALAPMPAKQRFALLYYYEEGLLRAGTKQIEIKILESAGDDGSTHDMDYDWADEAIHVGYGFKWLRHLLGDDNAGQAELKRLTDEARATMAAYVLEHHADPNAPLAPYFARLYDVIAAQIRAIPDDGQTFTWQPVVADESVLEQL
jgi:hypothetical protein